uniref:Protein-tyrosine-phosphatase n=1 Tax=Mesocestoides corti TaxID=53468 RepID=A0A5K3FV37_MESCO
MKAQMEFAFLLLLPLVKVECSVDPKPLGPNQVPATSIAAPSAPRPKESTSSSIVLSFDRSTEDKLHDFNYYAKKFRRNQARHPDAKGVLCDTSAAVCRMEGLQSNTAYKFVVKACATKPSELCSLNSPESVVMYTKPETPNAPTMKESTSNSITVTYTKKPSLADLAMSVRTSPVGGEAGETREFPCNNAKATCHLSGLEANRAYAVSLRACSTKRYEQRCSQWSDNTTMFTTPNQPDAPVLTESTSNSITVTYTKKSTETNLAVSVKASPVGGEAGETREAACNNEEATCHLSGLEANRAYSVSLKACTTDPTPHCSQWSKSTTIYTRPNQPRNLRLENVSSNQIEVSWEEPVPNAETISNYEVTAWDQNNRTTPCTFERSELKCSLKNLQPTTQYTVSVKACSRSNFCGAAVQASTWTRPEKPSNLVISRQEVNSIECKWQGLSSANKFVHYEVSLHYANSRHQIKAITVPAHRQVASFSYLHAHTSYSILLRACASDDSGRPRNCGEAVEASGYTRPSKPSALTIGERTSSTVLLHYRKLQEDNENSHFTYSLTYRTKEGGETRTIVCKTSAKTCYVTGLAANSEVTASLKACCSHGLCSPASPDILMYTKPGACENLRTINLAMTSIEVSWSKPRVNGEALTSYKAIATDPQGRQSFCVVPVENQERLVCTFQGLSPCLEYAISVNACARRNDCGLPVTMTASTLSVG